MKKDEKRLTPFQVLDARCRHSHRDRGEVSTVCVQRGLYRGLSSKTAIEQCCQETDSISPACHHAYAMTQNFPQQHCESPYNSLRDWGNYPQVCKEPCCSAWPGEGKIAALRGSLKWSFITGANMLKTYSNPLL